MLQTSVEMVKPGGTGTPARHISASPAPLPPRTSFILPSPSALPPPNEYTYLVVACFDWIVSASGRVMVAIYVLGVLFLSYFVDSLPSVTISEKSAIVENSFTRVC